MQGPGPPEGDERRLPGIAAAFRHVHSHCPRHRLVDDVVHGPRRLEHQLSAWPGEVLGDAVPGRVFIEAHRTAREVVGVEVAQQQVGIGHRRPGAAAAVADRPGVGAGALRPDLDEAHGVDPGDAAPPAPISIMLTAGTATGKPLDRVNRRERATSSLSVIGIAPSRMRHAFAVVPPMSNDRTSGSASACAIWRPTMAPATGPARTCAGNSTTRSPSPPGSAPAPRLLQPDLPKQSIRATCSPRDRVPAHAC